MTKKQAETLAEETSEELETQAPEETNVEQEVAQAPEGETVEQAPEGDTAQANNRKARPKSDSIPDLDELEGWVTTAKAAEMLGVKVASMSFIVYDGKVTGIRIAGVILVEKASVERYRESMKEREAELERKRAEREAEEKAKAEKKANQELLRSLTAEQLAEIKAKYGL